MKSTTMQINNSQLRASFVPSTFDPEKRTIDVVWTTGARVKRFSWSEGQYYEELAVKRTAVNLDRLNQGAPVLNNHNSWSLESNIGVVEKAWLKDGKGYATIRFSERDELQGLIKDIASGVIRNISVGYSVEKYEDVSKKKDKIKTYRAVSWTPLELSFVNIPADKDAQVRAADQEQY